MQHAWKNEICIQNCVEIPEEQRLLGTWENNVTMQIGREVSAIY